MKIKLLVLLFIVISKFNFGQDTIRLNTLPQVVISSWYPDFKESPKLKVGESTIVFTEIPDFKNLSIGNNDIDLISLDDKLTIEETDKLNQYIATVGSTNQTVIFAEVWFDMEDSVIFLYQDSNWVKITDILVTHNNRVLIDTIILKIAQ